MFAFLQQRRWLVGILLVIGGLMTLVASFWLPLSWAWIARMAALVAVAGGLQWQPTVEGWLGRNVYPRLAIATALGLVLVWMLVQYRQA